MCKQETRKTKQNKQTNKEDMFLFEAEEKVPSEGRSPKNMFGRHLWPLIQPLEHFPSSTSFMLLPQLCDLKPQLAT